jgi:hypothetical protein
VSSGRIILTDLCRIWEFPWFWVLLSILSRRVTCFENFSWFWVLSALSRRVSLLPWERFANQFFAEQISELSLLRIVCVSVLCWAFLNDWICFEHSLFVVRAVSLVLVFLFCVSVLRFPSLQNCFSEGLLLRVVSWSPLETFLVPIGFSLRNISLLLFVAMYSLVMIGFYFENNQFHFYYFFSALIHNHLKH